MKWALALKPDVKLKMNFLALPVNVGDSFLLRIDNKVILVDGGMNKGHIVNLLSKEVIPNNHIDLLVCTHYDADHINGIIGILKSQKYSFKELWLPEILGSIGYTLSENIHKLFEGFRDNDLKNFGEDTRSIFDMYEDLEIEGNENNNSLEKINSQMLSQFGWACYPYYQSGWNSGRIGNVSQSSILSYAHSVSSLISYSINSGSYIRWFKYQEQEVRKSYGFDMYSENAIQTDITLFDSKLLLLALYKLSLSSINKYSLVYMHKKENLPDVLFTADSDLSFYSRIISLQPSSIITSPHHGSAANDAAYQKIVGNDLVYVRSDRIQVKRPGNGYLNNKIRYCTVCRNITSKQKVELNYNGTRFFTNARPCRC